MTNTTQIFLKKIQGQWILQKTIYYINKKKLSVNKTENKIQAIKNTNKINPLSGYIDKIYTLQNINLKTNEIKYNLFTIKNNEGSIQKTINESTYHGQFELKSNKCLKTIFKRDGLLYIEYLYVITQNFKISISMIKTKNKYIAVTFTSCIKKIIA